MATGHNQILGLKKHTNTWGSGAAVQLGAGDGIEVDQDNLALQAGLIENPALAGYGTMRASKLGEKLVPGGFGPCPFYYRGLEVPLALAMGTAVAPAQQGGTAAYEHAYKMASSLDGLYATIAAGGADHPGVREVPHAKINGFQLQLQRGQLGKITFPIVGFDLHNNVGSPDPDLIVVAVDVADGAYTVAASPTYPSFVSITVVDANTSVTEHVVTVTGLDEDGNYLREVYTLSADGLTWTSTKRFSSITSVVGSATAGSVDAGVDQITVGVTNGVNNVDTYTSIAPPTTADRELLVFDQVRIWAKDQDGGAIDTSVATDEIYVASISVTLNPGLTQHVTTRFGNRVEEPHAGDFKRVEVGINFPSWDSANNAYFRDAAKAGRFKVHIRAQGPLADTGYPLELAIWLNDVQFNVPQIAAGGPGDLANDLTGVAHRAASSPTGLPSWADVQPMSIRLVNLRTTSALA